MVQSQSSKLHCTIGHEAVIEMKPGYSVAFTALTRQKVYAYIYPQDSYTVSASGLGCYCDGL
jgi:hypothetical protein